MGAASGLMQGGPKQGLYEISSEAKHRLGERLVLSDGREFVYCKAGSSNLSAALFHTYITTPTHEDTVTVAHSAGTTEVIVTASGVSANDFAEGYLVVTDGTGIGEIYKIRSNTATGGGGSGKIKVVLYDPLITAWSTSDTDVDLYPSPYNGLVVNPTDAQQRPVCVTIRPVTANYYFWGQVKGWAPVKIDTGGASAGQELDEKLVIASTNHAGQGMIVGSPTAGNGDYANIHPVLGVIVKEADVADDTVTLVDLML